MSASATQNVYKDFICWCLNEEIQLYLFFVLRFSLCERVCVCVCISWVLSQCTYHLSPGSDFLLRGTEKRRLKVAPLALSLNVCTSVCSETWMNACVRAMAAPTWYTFQFEEKVNENRDLWHFRKFIDSILTFCQGFFLLPGVCIAV